MIGELRRVAVRVIRQRRGRPTVDRELANTEDTDVDSSWHVRAVSNSAVKAVQSDRATAHPLGCDGPKWSNFGRALPDYLSKSADIARAGARGVFGGAR